MKKKFLLIFLICLFLMPVGVNAGYNGNCTASNNEGLLNDWQWGNASDEAKGIRYTHLAAGNVNYCSNTDESDFGSNGSTIYELSYSGATGNYRLYCLNKDFAAPVNSRLMYDATISGGPACAFYKYVGSNEKTRHNRVRYIQSKCHTPSNKCSNTACDEPYVSSNCGGSMKDTPVDKGNTLSLNATKQPDYENYFVYKASVSMSGKVTSYTPSLTTSISGAIITDSLAGTRSVTNTSASTLYVKIPKDSIKTVVSTKLHLKSNEYTSSCTYKKYDLIAYVPVNNFNSKERITTQQRVGFRRVTEVNPKKSFSKTASFSITVIPKDADKVELAIIKKSDDGKYLSGANFGLYSDSSCSSTIDTATTEDGSLAFVVDPNETYYIKETSAPEGYQSSNECRRIDVNENDVYETFTNTEIGVEPEYDTIEIEKVDMSDSSKTLAGAEFGLYSDSTCNNLVSDADGINKKTTGSSGIISFRVERGIEYYIKELTAPSGYSLNSVCMRASVGSKMVIQNDSYKESTVKKVDKTTKEGLSGAKIGLFTDSTCNTITTDVNGNDVLETGSDGTLKFVLESTKLYFVKEVVAPSGYENDIVSCRQIAPGGSVTFENEEQELLPQYDYINIKKVDKNNNSVAVEGAVFALYSDSNCTNLAFDRTGKYKSKSGKSGLSFFDVDISNTYYVKEIEAPPTYQLDSTCRVGIIGGTITIENAVKEIEYVDVSIKKVDKNDKSKVLSGAVFGIYSDSSCSNAISDADNNSTKITDASGIATFNVDSSKTYYTKELSAPSGYTIDDSCKELSTNTTITMENEKNKTYKKVDVRKIDEKTNEVLSDATFGIFLDKSCRIPYYDKNSVTNITTSNDGIASFEVDDSQSYYIKEISAPDGYTKSNDCHLAVVGGSITVSNSKEITYETIDVLKVDSEDNSIVLPGAEFGLYSDSNCSASATDFVGNSKAKTDGYGYLSFIVDNSQSYYIKEISAPDGYTLDDTCHLADTTNVIIVSNKKVVPDHGKIIVKKIDASDEKPIKNVKFELLKSDKVSRATDKDGNEIGVLTTDDNGRIEISNLLFGTYYLKELETEDVYILNDELVEISLDKESVSKKIENLRRTVLFLKQDSVSKESIAGGKYRVVDEEGNEVSEFAMKSGYYTLDMKAGNYKFIELEPPKNYVDVNLSFYFNVSENGIVTITSEEDRHYSVYEGSGIYIVNDKEEIVSNVPKTGVFDNKIIVLVGTLLILGGISSIVILKRKNH